MDPATLPEDLGASLRAAADASEGAEASPGPRPKGRYPAPQQLLERPMTAVGRAAASQQPPSFVTTLPNGELVVTQSATHQLLCLTMAGELRNVVDPAGSLLTFPTGIACDGDALYVADGLADRVFKLRLPDFRLLATSDKVRLHYPHGVCLHHPCGRKDGTLLFVADWGNHRIVALDAVTLAEVGTFGSKGRGPKQFMYPRSVARLDSTSAAPNGRLLVADTDNHRLQLLSVSGEFLAILGGLEQPYAAVGAPGGEERVFVATMGGRLCITTLPRLDELAPAAGRDRPGQQPAPAQEVDMPSGGAILCGLCSDGRRVYVAGLDEERQLHVLAARLGGSGRPGSASSRPGSGSGRPGSASGSGRPGSGSGRPGSASAGGALGGLNGRPGLFDQPHPQRRLQQRPLGSEGGSAAEAGALGFASPFGGSAVGRGGAGPAADLAALSLTDRAAAPSGDGGGEWGADPAPSASPRPGSGSGGAAAGRRRDPRRAAAGAAAGAPA